MIAVPINVVFGLQPHGVAKFQFRGKAILTIIDMPFSVSPVIAGFNVGADFGTQKLVGGWIHGS